MPVGDPKVRLHRAQVPGEVFCLGQQRRGTLAPPRSPHIAWGNLSIFPQVFVVFFFLGGYFDYEL